MPCNCGSDKESNLIYACSGAANTGPGTTGHIAGLATA